MIVNILDKIDSVMYYPVLIIILVFGGLYFTIRTRFVQIRQFKESCRLIMEPPTPPQKISSFQAMIVSTASRVGTGNIVGVSSAICLGGPGAVFWMWLMCIVGASSAFTESTLAQIYKKKDKNGDAYGGPAYYIEKAFKSRIPAVIFCFFLLMTYSFGFQLLCSYNLQTTFAGYSFYDPKTTPAIIGAILAVLVGYCIFGGGKRIIKLTSSVVPAMGIFYVIIALIVIFANIRNIPHMFAIIFEDAFNFKAIFGGMSGSCLIYGVKRGLYSNEAGVGSAPNASASAMVSHPVKQGLAQTLSVYIDTMLLCTATALMCLSTGVYYGAEVEGAPYVQNAISSLFGRVGPIFITIAMILFAFTTLLGNLYYTDNALAYMNHKKLPGKKFMTCFKIFCIFVVFAGAVIPSKAAWALADISMGGMTLINIPACVILGGAVFKALKDYEDQKKLGKNPIFFSKDIGLNEDDFDFWKEGDLSHVPEENREQIEA